MFNITVIIGVARVTENLCFPKYPHQLEISPDKEIFWKKRSTLFHLNIS